MIISVLHVVCFGADQIHPCPHVKATFSNVLPELKKEEHMHRGLIKGRVLGWWRHAAYLSLALSNTHIHTQLHAGTKALGQIELVLFRKCD